MATTDDNPSDVLYPNSYVVISIKRYYDLMEEDADGNLFQSNPVRIPDGAYLNRAMLSELNFPDTITVGKNAFKLCARVQRVNMPEVTSIGDGAFLGCDSITTLSFPKLTAVNNMTFQTCQSLQTIDVPKATSVGYNAFQDCVSLVSVDVPLATSIGDYAFRGCRELSTVNVPRAESIGEGAFYGCEKLKRLILPQASTIGASAFAECTNLVSIHLPMAKEVQADQFTGCAQLKRLNLQNVPAAGVPDNALTELESLEWINLSCEIPLQSMEDYLATLGVPDDCNAICSDGFVKFMGGKTPENYKRDDIFTYQRETVDGEPKQFISSIKSANVSGKIVNSQIVEEDLCEGFANGLKPRALMGQLNIKTVFMPSLGVRVGESAFQGCTNLSEVEFPVLVTGPNNGIMADAFKDCPNMKFLCISNIDVNDAVEQMNAKQNWGLPPKCVVACRGGLIRVGESGENLQVVRCN